MLLGGTNAFASGPEGDVHEEDPIEAMMHHLGDANEFHLFGNLAVPLPCIAWSEDGMMFTMSSAFEHGHKAVKGYVLHHGILMRVLGEDFPKETVEVTFGHSHGQEHATHGHADAHLHDHNSDQIVNVDGIKNGQVVDNPIENDSENALAKEEDNIATVATVEYNGKSYPLEAAMSLQNTSSSWQDFSITKNVFVMLLAFLLLILVFSAISKAYTKREKQAPKGIQSFFEPILLFMRDEVVKPAIGDKDWKRFFPFIMSLFFFILFCNLLGLIPFFPGSANITGNLGVTIVLAVIVFIVVNINGTKDYWMHILWMPGIPTAVKPLLSIIEILSLFIKPATLFIRLFANITAGHVIILSLVSLIFFFNTAMGTGGAIAGGAIAIPFVFAMNLLELFVAFLQAFVFALLASLYIGSAVETHDDHDHGHEHATS
jgi:F-type H+-transporting ATPase subunit a